MKTSELAQEQSHSGKIIKELDQNVRPFLVLTICIFTCSTAVQPPAAKWQNFSSIIHASTCQVMLQIVVGLCLSDHDKKGTNMNSRTMKYGCLQNKDCVGGWGTVAQWISHLLTLPRDLGSHPGGGKNLLYKLYVLFI